MIFKEELFHKIRDILLAHQDQFGKIFLVGGYIRDTLIYRTPQDFDFVLSDNPIIAAQIIADKFCGDFYILDKERHTSRAIIRWNDRDDIYVDFSRLFGGGIDTDLKSRDFTINAIAVDLSDPDKIIDPLKGVADLKNSNINLCNENSFEQDPLRVIRAVRFIQMLNLEYSKSFQNKIESGLKKIDQVSGERIRDEVFQIFSLHTFSGALDLMDTFNILPKIFPELHGLKDIFPGYPHVHNVFKHSIRLTEKLNLLIEVFLSNNKNFKDPILIKAKSMFSPYGAGLKAIFTREITPARKISQLILFAALYHDVAKTMVTPVQKNNKLSFPLHAEKGALIAARRAKELALSNGEIDFIRCVVEKHMLKEFQSLSPRENINLQVFRFFKEASHCGISAAILHLADVWATYENGLTDDRWRKALNIVNRILNGWFNRYNELVCPPDLIDGDDLIGKFNLEPGKKIGELLNLVKENQVTGKITERKEAFNFLENYLKE